MEFLRDLRYFMLNDLTGWIAIAVVILAFKIGLYCGSLSMLGLVVGIMISYDNVKSSRG